jgi:hypothetical protein
MHFISRGFVPGRGLFTMSEEREMRLELETDIWLQAFDIVSMAS